MVFQEPGDQVPTSDVLPVDFGQDHIVQRLGACGRGERRTEEEGSKDSHGSHYGSISNRVN